MQKKIYNELDISEAIMATPAYVFNKPDVSGAVLKSPLSFIH